jgi:hypothetical protein
MPYVSRVGGKEQNTQEDVVEGPPFPSPWWAFAWECRIGMLPRRSSRTGSPRWLTCSPADLPANRKRWTSPDSTRRSTGPDQAHSHAACGVLCSGRYGALGGMRTAVSLAGPGSARPGAARQAPVRLRETSGIAGSHGCRVTGMRTQPVPLCLSASAAPLRSRRTPSRSG